VSAPVTVVYGTRGVAVYVWGLLQFSGVEPTVCSVLSALEDVTIGKVVTQHLNIDGCDAFDTGDPADWPAWFSSFPEGVFLA
jgi:hypothetical protein